MPLTRKTYLLAKQEATYGTDPIHAADDALLVSNLVVSVVAEGHARPMDGATASLLRAGVLGRAHIEVNFDCTLRNGADIDSGVEPIYGILLEACGFAPTYAAGPPKTQTYSPVTDHASHESVAFQINMDGLEFLVLGCRGNVSGKLTPGAPAVLSFAYKGLYATPTSVAQLTPTYADDAAPPIVQNTGLAQFSDAPTADIMGHVRDVTFDCRNNVEVIGSETAAAGQQGAVRVMILGRGSDGDPGMAVTMEVEQGTQGGTPDSQVWWTRWTGRTESASCAMQIGTLDNNKHVVTFTKLVVHEGAPPNPTDLNGVVGLMADCRAMGSSGDDEITIACYEVP